MQLEHFKVIIIHRDRTIDGLKVKKGIEREVIYFGIDDRFFLILLKGNAVVLQFENIGYF